MYKRSNKDFWWNDITGAKNLVDKVIDAMLEKKHIALHIPSDIPWRDAMRACVQKRIKSDSHLYNNVIVEIIDITDEYNYEQSPGVFLLQRFAKSSIINGYRENARVTVQKYISKNNVLKNRIIWLKGMDDETTDIWVDFCKEFKQDDDATFILEIKNNSSLKEYELFKDVYFNNTVFPYDVYLFNSILLSDRHSYTDIWKNYISTVAVNLCDVDVELSCYFINNTNFREEDCIESLKNISLLPEFMRRGADDNPKHILAICRKNLDDELHKKLWTAQLKVLFPIIEMERMKIIENNLMALQEILDKYSIKQYEEVLSNPYEIELGTLKYIYEKKIYNGCDKIEYKKINFLRECRNKLAHISYCNYEDVRKLLDADYR